MAGVGDVPLIVEAEKVEKAVGEYPYFLTNQRRNSATKGVRSSTT